MVCTPTSLIQQMQEMALVIEIEHHALNDGCKVEISSQEEIIVLVEVRCGSVESVVNLLQFASALLGVCLC
jgi:hypothetical protein